MSRPVYVLVFPSPLFPAHWSLFIPSLTNQSIGIRIHVHGDAKSGFAHEFVRGYDMGQSTQGDKLVLLGEVDEGFLAGDEDESTGVREEDGGEQTETRDVDPRNELERIALGVPAPGPSLNSVQNQPKGKRVAIQNCQTWLRQLIATYVAKGILGTDALDAVNDAPKN